MMKKITFIAFTVMFIQTSMMAQTYSYYTDPATGLNYLYVDGTAPEIKSNLMIYVGANAMGTPGEPGYIDQNEFLVDGTIRGNWRRYVLENNAASFWERERDDNKGLDQITEIKYPYGSVMTYAGVEYFPELTTLYVRSEGDGPKNNGGASLDLHYNKKLTTLEFKYQKGNAANGYFKDIDVSNTKITTLSIPNNSATYLEDLKLENLSTLTRLQFGTASNFTKIEKLDISQTGIVSAANLVNVAKLTNLGIFVTDKEKLSRDAITLPNVNDEWVLKHEDGDIQTWVYPSKEKHVEVWVDIEGTEIDLVEYTSMESLIIHGEANSVKLPADRTKLTIDLTDCPNASIDWNGNESSLKKLTLKNVASFDATDFTSLIVLRYLEPASADLTLSADNTELLTLDITRSGLTELNLYDNGTVLAPYLTSVKTWYAPITLLDLTGHDYLLSAPYPTNEKMNPYGESDVYVDVDEDGDHFFYLSEVDPGAVKEIDPDKWPGLNIVPTPKSQIDYYAIHAEHANYENGITDIENYNANNVLKTIILKGCTSLTDVYLSHGFDMGNASTLVSHDTLVYYNQIKEVDASDCTYMTGIYLANSMLSSLNVSNGDNLETISIDQGKLTGDGDINLSNCPNLKVFIAERQKLTNLDFLLSTSNRTAEEIAKLQHIQVDGGSYTLMNPSGTKFIRTDDDDSEKPMKITNCIREIDLSNLSCWDGGDAQDGLRVLSVDCNLLSQLDLSGVGPGLKELHCNNNMLTTLNLNPLTESARAGRFDFENSTWKHQVGFSCAEVVKGHWNESAGTWETFANSQEESEKSGSFDWVTLHLKNGGFSHKMDNNFGLYWNLYDARANNDAGQNQITSEATPWMCKVKEVADIENRELDGYEKFNGDHLRPVTALEENDQYIFLHSQDEIKSHFGAFKDQDLTGCILTYKYNTGFMHKEVASIFSGDLNHSTNDYSLVEYEQGTGTSQFDYTSFGHTQEEVSDKAHILVRMHLYPHLLNINPASKSPMSVDKKRVDYFSSTICLDYDAKIPAGVTCYTISGVVDDADRVFEVAGQALDGQLNVVPFGGEDDEDGNWILPANTPVYVRAKSPQPAGLYAFEPIHEIQLLGWENLRGEGGQADYILHGIDNLNSGGVKPEYETALETAKNRLKAGGKNATNILEGFIAPKYDVDINDVNYNKVVEATQYLSVGRRTVLVLGVQNQKSSWPVIGFWPYNGTTLPTNRCFIRYGSVYPSGTPSAAKGFNFFFVGEEGTGGNVTGINAVGNTNDAQDVWYNMQGVRFNKRPTQHGVYIHNNQKVVIK